MTRRIIHAALAGLFALSPLALPTAMPIAQAQHEDHDHHGDAKPKPEPAPTIYLDKAPRIVEFQLRQLSNQQLVALERKTDHLKYVPIYAALLTRPGLEGKYRREAVQALIALNKSDGCRELLAAITKIDGDTDEDSLAPRRALINELGVMLLREKKELLTRRRDDLETLAGDGNDARARETGYAALLIADGELEPALQLTMLKENGQRYLLGAAALIKDKALLSALYPVAEAAIAQSSDEETRIAAIHALSHVPGKEGDAFAALATLLTQGDPAAGAAAAAIKRIPAEKWPKQNLLPLAQAIVKLLEQTPTDDRTSDAAIDAVQLGHEVASRLEQDQAAAIRKSLSALGVQVIVLKAPVEQMIFDQKWFAVEAGKPVQIIFQNTDVMPHNFVLVTPGSLEEIGTAAESMAPSADPTLKQFVPDSPKVLAAMQLVQLGETGRLSFTAPTEPGEYPYVCTYPGHWRRMYGVMVVVSDLEAFNKSPKEPKDPLGNTRSLVKMWTIDDLKPRLAALDKASAQRGKLLFAEAGCHLCHKVNGQGGAVGPELGEVFKKFKGNREDVLREILEPSKVIDEKYRPQIIETSDGDRVFGLVTEETDEAVMVVSNPQNPVPRRVLKSDIEDRTKSQTSLMPTGLMNIFKESEILDVLKYLESPAPGPAPGPKPTDHNH